MDLSKLNIFNQKIIQILPAIPDSFIFVDCTLQQLYLLNNSIKIRSYPVSTSRFGIGNQSGSYKTPSGIHRICEKIGADAPSGRIFRDRCDTGTNWQPGTDEENLILTRILRLEGLEDGINRGSGIDSFERYIYIHGTNREANIGTPVSHGCVCMRNNDIIELFDIIKEGTIVYID